MVEILSDNNVDISLAFRAIVIPSPTIWKFTQHRLFSKNDICPLIYRVSFRMGASDGLNDQAVESLLRLGSQIPSWVYVNIKNQHTNVISLSLGARAS